MSFSEKKIKVLLKPNKLEIKANKGTSVLDNILETGMHINASCGGKGTCGKCKILIEKGSVKGGLNEHLSLNDKKQGIHLACQSKIVKDVVIKILDEFRFNKSDFINLKKESSNQRKYTLSAIKNLKDTFEYNPIVKKELIKLEPPTLKDNRSDVSRLLNSLRKKYMYYFNPEHEIITGLPQVLRKKNWQITLTILEPIESPFVTNKHKCITKIESGDTTNHNFAMAVDLGTTTIWVQFIDLNSGEILGTESDFNSQISFGEDIISRIIYASDPKKLSLLQKSSTDSINKIAMKLAKKINLDLNKVNLCVVAGNTTMTQLLLGINPKYIRIEPYIPTLNYYSPLKANKIGITLKDSGKLLLFPSISSYVGGDIVAGILATNMHKSEKISLLIDLGTNGEVVIGNQDWLACASASAGPAFEGGGIKFGMRAMGGAIENFSIDPLTKEPVLSVIGNTSPVGICGSGLIASIANLFLAGIINEKGKLNPNYPSKRVHLDKEEGLIYILAWESESENNKKIFLTEPDINNLILAKGAMFASYMTLLTQLGLSITDIEDIYIAGSFGQNIDLNQAQTIGLLPEIPLKQIKFIGNSSLTGASLICLSNQLRSEVLQIMKKTTNFELSIIPEYMDNYISSLFLPHTESENLFPLTHKLLKKKRHV